LENKNNATPIPGQSSADAFIVRIWKDSTDEQGQTTAWHGSIDHVGSSNRLYFRKLDSIVQFVRERSGVEAGSVKHWPKWLASWLQGFRLNSK
jgi:hypothetical protein